jgi:quercetin dioxygenase-like cupin family protein
LEGSDFRLQNHRCAGHSGQLFSGTEKAGYEGKEHPIKAGENFHFAKAGLHSVKAVKKFKMALLLTLE